MIIIPARLASTRFANKILCDINGFPMVIATAKRVQSVDEVVIATDSEEVKNICKKYGFKAVLTSKLHQSGTDRINEASKILALSDDEIVINVQADEPFIETSVVQAAKNAILNDKSALMSSCYKLISGESIEDPNQVKVVVDAKGYAIYFSRSKIPFNRDKCDEYYGHLGIYAFRYSGLKKFCSFKMAPLEKIEKLEQLRAIYNGEKIIMAKVESNSFGIDTKEDLKKALEFFKN